MTDDKQVQQQAALSLERLWPRLEITFLNKGIVAPADWSEFERRLRYEWERLFVVANFSEHPQEMDSDLLRMYGSGYSFTDIMTCKILTAERSLQLEPYQCLWLEAHGTI